MTGTTAAIAGLGITAQGKVYGRSAPQFAAEAVRLASADAGLQSGDIDGLLVSGGLTNALGVDLQGTLGLTSATAGETGDRAGAWRPSPSASCAGAAIWHAASAAENDLEERPVRIVPDPRRARPASEPAGAGVRHDMAEPGVRV